MRPVTKNLIDSIMMDIWPRAAAICDFGISSQSHYEALWHGVRSGEIKPHQLEIALGDGPALTKLAQGCKSNPHKAITFKTPYDGM